MNEEERRLFYGGLMWSGDWVYVCFPQRYYHGFRASRTDRYGYAQLTRFIAKIGEAAISVPLGGHGRLV